MLVGQFLTHTRARAHAHTHRGGDKCVLKDLDFIEVKRRISLPPPIKEKFLAAIKSDSEVHDTTRHDDTTNDDTTRTQPTSWSTQVVLLFV